MMRSRFAAAFCRLTLTSAPQPCIAVSLLDSLYDERHQ
jgi:hypothetical protein